MALSSCGLIEGSKTPEQPTDSKEATGEVEYELANDSADLNMDDDLFSKTLNETNDTSQSDNPTALASDDNDLMSLQEEVAPSNLESPETEIALAPTKSQPTQEIPFLVEEDLPEIKKEVEQESYSQAGQIKTYNVQRGDTLMQIAFKLYGDTTKWKEIKNMNSDKITNNTSLRTNTQLKYRAPNAPFVWNPSGVPYIIKSGDTLGTISNSVYSTPTKWKDIWENNKPLIKNPNVIYAGFTVYYNNGGMANFVQPKSDQPVKEILANEYARDSVKREGVIEEVLVEKAITRENTYKAPIISKTKTIIEAQTLALGEETQSDEAVQTLSATKREQVANAILKTKSASKEKELDLVNNISIPYDNNEMEPDIDEEYQTL